MLIAASRVIPLVVLKTEAQLEMQRSFLNPNMLIWTDNGGQHYAKIMFINIQYDPEYDDLKPHAVGLWWALKSPQLPQNLTTACEALAIKPTISQHLAIKLRYSTNRPGPRHYRLSQSGAFTVDYTSLTLSMKKPVSFVLIFLSLSLTPDSCKHHSNAIMVNPHPVPRHPLFHSNSPEASGVPVANERGDFSFNPWVEQASVQTLKMRPRRCRVTLILASLQHMCLKQ